MIITALTVIVVQHSTAQHTQHTQHSTAHAHKHKLLFEFEFRLLWKFWWGGGERGRGVWRVWVGVRVGGEAALYGVYYYHYGYDYYLRTLYTVARYSYYLLQYLLRLYGKYRLATTVQCSTTTVLLPVQANILIISVLCGYCIAPYSWHDFVLA